MSASNEINQAQQAWMDGVLTQVEQALSDWVAPTAPERLDEAMRYAVLDGGKRLRPLLVFAAAQAVGAQKDCPATLRAACAVELIHAYSLVHDDMPCMDNDVLRRGKPTVHVKFGQAQALLAGDALQALAFELLTPTEDVVDATTQAKLCRLLAMSAGCHGMAGGQAIDLANVVALEFGSVETHAQIENRCIVASQCDDGSGLCATRSNCIRTSTTCFAALWRSFGCGFSSG